MSEPRRTMSNTARFQPWHSLTELGERWASAGRALGRTSFGASDAQDVHGLLAKSNDTDLGQ